MNPYRAPAELERNAEPAANAIGFHRRWWGALMIGALGQFLIWCLADVFYVRFGIRPADETFLPVPLLTILLEAWLLRSQDRWLLKSIVLGLASTAVTVVLVLFFGIPFHFALGGSL